MVLNFRDVEIDYGAFETSEKMRAFLIFFNGKIIERKLRKVCDAFNCKVYPCPSFDQLQDVKMEVQTRLSEVGKKEEKEKLDVHLRLFS
jgi:vacuolar-type H+-ATPase subunit I/STV1